MQFSRRHDCLRCSLRSLLAECIGVYGPQVCDDSNLLSDGMFYAKSRDLIGWITEHGPFIHFRIDGPTFYMAFGYSKNTLFGEMENTIGRGWL